MSTDVSVSAPELTLLDEQQLADRVERVFEESERRFSRFCDTSELSQLNRATEPQRVSPQMFDALERARRYVELTAGLFDPTIGAALVAAGYDRSFAPGELDRDQLLGRALPSCFDDISIDPESLTVTRPAHVQLDFGGFIKGYTVDRASELLPEHAAIDAGGDCVLRGPAAWEVEIEDPRDPRGILMVLRVKNRAVATSAANRRRWKVGGEERHHLIDPRTLASARSDLAQVTVVAGRAELADVLAKTAFLLGRRAALAFLETLPEVGAVLIGSDRSRTLVGDVEVRDV